MRRNTLKLSPRVTLLLVGLAAALWVHSAAPAQSHGAKIEVFPQAVEIIATFDTGEPMDNAQVAVYAPDAPDEPWQTGQTDSEGRFSFTPDAALDTSTAGGRWEVTVRKGGHGQTTSFALGGDADSRATSAQTATAQSAVQKWLSMAAIIWGFVGTALFFSRKPGNGGYSRSTATVGPALETAQTANHRATVAAGAGRDRKASDKESR